MLLYGALAGAAAETAIYPLEIVRRRLQLQSMAAAHGTCHSMQPTIFRVCCLDTYILSHQLLPGSWKAQKFGGWNGGCQSTMRSVVDLKSYTNQQRPVPEPNMMCHIRATAALADAAGGSSAGAALQAVRGLNSWRALSTTAVAIFQQEGVRGFYTGLLPNTLQVLPNAALSYFAYETFKTLLEVKE